MKSGPCAEGQNAKKSFRNPSIPAAIVNQKSMRTNTGPQWTMPVCNTLQYAQILNQKKCLFVVQILTLRSEEYHYYEYVVLRVPFFSFLQNLTKQKNGLLLKV